jgi:hypothetical protein
VLATILVAIFAFRMFAYAGSAVEAQLPANGSINVMKMMIDFPTNSLPVENIQDLV